MKLHYLISYLLTENINGGLSEDVLEIANYPEGFNINQLKDQISFAAKVRYLRSHGLDKLGAGSSRAAFIADNDTVIKVAKNKKGLAQNKVEAELSANVSTDAPIARVKDSDPDNVWIESERARKAKPTDFKNLIGFQMEHIMKTLTEKLDQLKSDDSHHVKRNWRYLRDRILFKQISETDFISDLLEIIHHHNLSMGDIERISSWGVVNRNGIHYLVLVDYGLDRNVFQTHYKRF